MSADEVSALREDISVLRCLVEERAKSAHANSTMLKTIGAAVIVQLFCTVYFAGQKTQLLDRLQTDVEKIQLKVEAK
jgi:hypothetical protein